SSTWRVPEGGTYKAEHDPAGRVTALYQGDRLLLRQRWRPDGLPASVADEQAALYPRYGPKDGALETLYLAAPTEGSTFVRLLTVQLDKEGRPSEMKTSPRSAIKLSYDKDGGLQAVTSPRGSVEIKRGDQGRVTEVSTSWGQRRVHSYLPNRREKVMLFADRQ